MRRLALAALLALVSTFARAGTEQLDFTWDNGLHLVVQSPLGMSWGTLTVTENAGALAFDIALSQSIVPNFFYTPSGTAPTIGFNLNVIDATVSNIVFNGGAVGRVVAGATMGGAGAFDYGLTCDNCPIFGSMLGQPAATNVSFTVNAPGGLTLGNLEPNSNGAISAAQTWILAVADDCPVAAVGIIADPNIGPAVPEPSTWAMMLIGFVGLTFAFRQTQRKASFA
jgi:PEP-CTERM motif